jgi:hypothetical protein
MIDVGWKPQKLFANLLRSCKSLWGYTINAFYVGLRSHILFMFMIKYIKFRFCIIFDFNGHLITHSYNYAVFVFHIQIAHTFSYIDQYEIPARSLSKPIVETIFGSPYWTGLKPYRHMHHFSFIL